MGVRVVFLPNCPLVFSLLKYKDVGALWTKKMKISIKCNYYYQRDMLYHLVYVRVDAEGKA